MSGRWDQSGIPHRGWRCVDVVDVRAGPRPEDEIGYATCEMCGKEKIRFVHTMEHGEHEPLDVGCICAEKMSEDYVTPRRWEQKLRNRAARRSKWLTRRWRVSAKGNEYLNVDGLNLVVFPKTGRPGSWSYRIGGEFAREAFDTEDAAKLTMFDAYWELSRDD